LRSIILGALRKAPYRIVQGCRRGGSRTASMKHKDLQLKAADLKTRPSRCALLGLQPPKGNRASSEEAALRKYSVGQFQNEQAGIGIVPPLTAQFEQPVAR